MTRHHQLNQAADFLEQMTEPAAVGASAVGHNRVAVGHNHLAEDRACAGKWFAAAGRQSNPRHFDNRHCLGRRGQAVFQPRLYWLLNAQAWIFSGLQHHALACLQKAHARFGAVGSMPRKVQSWCATCFHRLRSC